MLPPPLRMVRLFLALSLSIAFTTPDSLRVVPALAAPPSAAASILVVTNTTDSSPGSLRAVLIAAQMNDTIQFSLTANSTIVLTSGELTVTVPLTIDGSTATNLTLSGNGASRVIEATAPLTVLVQDQVTFLGATRCGS